MSDAHDRAKMLKRKLSNLVEQIGNLERTIPKTAPVSHLTDSNIRPAKNSLVADDSFLGAPFRKEQLK